MYGDLRFVGIDQAVRISIDQSIRTGQVYYEVAFGLKSAVYEIAMTSSSSTRRCMMDTLVGLSGDEDSSLAEYHADRDERNVYLEYVGV